MSEFCVKCSQHEGDMELLVKRHHMEMQCMKQKLKEAKELADKLQTEVDSLSLDLAFYAGNLINLSCNKK